MTPYEKFHRDFAAEQERHRKAMRRIDRNYYIGLAVVVVMLALVAAL